MALRNLLLRFAFGVLLAALSFLVARAKIRGKLVHWTDRQFDQYFITFYAAGRLLIFLAAFFVLHQRPWADLVAFYVPQAHAVMNGQVPYRDFESSYAPLNPYLDALLLRLHDSPLSILVFQIFCDVLSVPFWIRFLRRFMPETTVRKAALLYFIQPLVIWEICLDGKNQGLISLLLAISLWAVARREILSGLSLCCTWILVKILPLMFLPALFVGARRRIRWLVSAVVPTAIVYGAFVASGADVTSAMRKEGSLTTPQNLPYIWAALTGHNLPGIVSSLLSLAVVGVTLVVAISSQLRAESESAKLWKMALGAQLLLLAVMVVNKKSDTSYLGMCFFLLCSFVAFEADRGRRTMSALYTLLSAVALPIASFWFWPLHQESGTKLHALCVSGDRNGLVMLGMQVLLLLSYVGLSWGLLRCIRGVPRDLVVNSAGADR